MQRKHYIGLGILLVGIFVLSLVSTTCNHQQSNQTLTQENYKAMVLSKIVPIGYAEPTVYDIDTGLKLKGEDVIYSLYESGKFPTEGRLFISKN